MAPSGTATVSQTDSIPATGSQEGGERIVERHRGLVRRTVLVSGLTLASRILGFVREFLSAALFGATSPIFDAFLTAWRVPNLFRRFFGEGALSTSLQTALTKVDHERGDDAGRALFGRTLRTTTWLLGGLCAVCMVGLLLLGPTLHAGWLGELEGAQAALELAIRMFPFVLLICLAALFAGALAVRGHFLTPSLAPVAMNLVWIGALVLLIGGVAGADPLRQVRWLAWAVLLAGLVQLAVQLPAAFSRGLLVRGGEPDAEPRPGEGGWDVLKRAAPLAFGAAIYQVNVMVDGLMAESLLPVGAPTAHYYANRIQQFPLALVATAAASSVFPALNALGAVGRGDELRRLHDRAQLGVAALAFPAGFGLLVLAPEITSALLQHGKFDAAGAERTANALAVLGLALVPAGAVGLASRVYYALDDLRTPVLVSAAMLVINAGLNLAFVLGAGTDVEGLALATMITSWLHLAVLVPGFRKLGLPAAPTGTWTGIGLRLGVGAASGAVAWLTSIGVGLALPVELGDATRAALQLASAIPASLLAFIATGYALGLPEASSFVARVTRRGGGAPPPVDK